MAIPTDVVKFICPAIFGQLRASWNWSQTDGKVSQFSRNLIASITAGVSISVIGAARNQALMTAGGIFIGVGAPVVLGTASLILYALDANPKGRIYRAVNALHERCDRFAQVINLVCCVAFCALGTPFFGWAGVALTLQFITLALCISFDEKKEAMREATRYVRGHKALYPENADSLVQQAGFKKSYYHLLTIANEDVQDGLGSEFRSNLLGLIGETDDTEKPNHTQQAVKLSKLAFELENIGDATQRKNRLENVAFEYGRERDRARNSNAAANGARG